MLVAIRRRCVCLPLCSSRRHQETKNPGREITPPSSLPHPSLFSRLSRFTQPPPPLKCRHRAHTTPVLPTSTYKRDPDVSWASSTHSTRRRHVHHHLVRVVRLLGCLVCSSKVRRKILSQDDGVEADPPTETTAVAAATVALGLTSASHSPMGSATGVFK